MKPLKEFEEQLSALGYDPDYSVNTKFNGSLKQLTELREVKHDLERYGCVKVFAVNKQPIKNLYTNENYSLDYLLSINCTETGLQVTHLDVQLHHNLDWEANYVVTDLNEMPALKCIVKAFGDCIPNTKDQNFKREHVLNAPENLENFDLTHCTVKQIVDWLKELNKNAKLKGYDPLYPIERDKVIVLDINSDHGTSLKVPDKQIEGNAVYQFSTKYHRRTGFDIDTVKITPYQIGREIRSLKIRPKSTLEMPSKLVFANAVNQIGQKSKNLRKGIKL